MANRNLALQLLITAKDEASAVFGKVFSALNDGTNVIATTVRDGFTNLFGGAVDSAAAFEQQLGKVQAKGDESYQDTEKLKTGLQTLAAQFGITGTEAAQGMEVLAAAGLNASDAMKALPAVLNLAKMENLSLDDAATKLSDTLSIVGLGFAEAGRMADVLAKGANISTASAASLAEALSVAGGQAKSAGMDLEATVAALDLLHSAGIKGSAAGTSLSAILTQLQNPASAASKELNKLGINTRDLGGVLDGLNGAGVKSGAAILAFGETAGPGLQAMISKGSAALGEYDTQLRNSGGAAQEAATKLDQNFNSALAALAAAWDSVKGALAEPILKPIADGAREVAMALNTALTAGAVKPAQEAIKTFATEGVAAIKDFVKNFDFQVAITAIGEFFTSAKASFEGIKTAGQTASDGVTLAWNAVTAGFKTIAAGLLAIAAQTVSALAATDQAAAKIGLGSVERANELRQIASALEATAAELIAQVGRDSAEMGAAYDRMTGKTAEAKAAQEQLKTALPKAEFEAINYTLKDYQAFADQANVATEAARVAHEAGKLSAQDYGVKLMEAAEANKALKDATDEQTAKAATQQAQADKTTLATAELTGKLANWSREIKYANEMAEGWNSGMALNAVKMIGLRDAATATAEKLAYLTSVKATLVNGDKQIAEATAEAKAALDRYNTALGEHTTQLEAKKAAVERSNTIEQKGYDLLIQNAKAEGELATLKGDTEAATRKETEATDLQNQKSAAAITKKEEEIAVYKDLIAATKEKLAADGELNQADQVQLATMADTLTGMTQEREGMAQSLQTTQALTAAKKAKKEADEAAATAAKEAA
ncbi:MAG: phage tail tape measure protein, partial [Candidatus Competibacteraceae bacterium]